MIKRYNIAESIPSPHDCVITGINVEHDHMIFNFEKDLFNRESIQMIHQHYHYVGSREMIIHLSGKSNYVLYVCADSVELEWVESMKYVL